LNRIKQSFLLRLFLSFSGGILLFFAFPPFNAGFLAFFGFIPVLISSRENDKRNFLIGAAAGFVFYSISFSWLYPLAGFLYLLLPLYLCLYWGLFLHLLFLLPAKGRIFTGAFIWFFLEIIVSNMLTGLPWLLLGLSQWQNTHMLKIAGVCGIYGISFIVILGNLALFHIFRKKNAVSFFFSLLVFVLVFVFPYERLDSTMDSGRLDVMIVQPGVISKESRNPGEILNAVKNLTEKNIKIGNPSLVIWPEGSFPDILSDYPGFMKDIEVFCRKFSVSLIMGTFVNEGNELYNSAIMFGHDGLQVYRKNHLVPYGEFILGGNWRFIRDIFEKTAGYIPNIKHGDEQKMFYMNGVKIAPLICFENIFPGMTKNSSKRKAEVFVVITNDSWYGTFSGPFQHFAHNALRAAESGRYFLQASLAGISGAVSPSGKILGAVEKEGRKLFVEGVVFTGIPLKKGSTFYSEHGDLALFIIAVLFTGVILCRKQKK